MHINASFTIVTPVFSHLMAHSYAYVRSEWSLSLSSLSLSVYFWFGLSQWKEKAALINRSESFSTPQWFQAQLGKLNIIKAQGKGCTFLEIVGGVVQEVACYRRKTRCHACSVQHAWAQRIHRAAAVRGGGGGGGGLEREKRGWQPLQSQENSLHMSLSITGTLALTLCFSGWHTHFTFISLRRCT